MASEEFNPKTHRAGPACSKATAFNFAEVKNPISMEIKDPKDVVKMFNRWPLVPYSGSLSGSTHGLLYFLNSSRFISPTLGACHESIKTYIFGGKMGVRAKVDSEFDIGEEIEELSLENKRAYVAFIKSLDLKGLSFTKLSCNLYDSFKGNGNYWLEVIHTETAGVKQTSICYHPTENCCYWATEKGKDKIAAISPVWTDQYLRKNPPTLVPLYPNYGKSKDGTLRTLIHVKNGNFEWYGRPDWIGAWVNVYREYQDSDYLVKAAANRFTGEVFIEIEEDDIENDNLLDDEDAIESGFDSVTDRIEKNFTSKSDDPQTIMVTTRPFGAGKAFVYQFKPVTNEKFFETTSKINRQKLIENNQWSERLLGNSVSEGFSKDSHLAELKVKDVSVLSSYRNNIGYGVNLAISEAAKFQGMIGFENTEYYYKSVMDSLEDAPEKTSDVKSVLDAYGIAVRAGAITPNVKDENFFRELLGIEEINEHTAEAWEEDGGYRRPITLKGAEDSQSEQTRTGDE